MIPQAAVDAFLSAPRDDHRWLKQLTTPALDKALALIQPRPKINSAMRVHQKVCIYLGIAYPQFAFWLDMGTGKTAVSLELLRYWWQCGQLRRALIFVTSDKAFPTWEKQIKRWTIELPYVMLDASSSAEKWKMLERFDDGLILITYPGAVAMTSVRVKSKGNKNRMKLDPKLIARLADRVDALVLDESTRCGNFDSLTSKLCAKVRQTSRVCYALAGRPFGRDPTLLWSQHHIVDGGETLGETLGLFRAAFYSEADNYWGGPYSKNYTFKKSMKAQLMRMVQHRSIAYAAEECIDLPAEIPIIEEVRLPGEAHTYYRKVVQQIIAAQGNLEEMKNAFTRMRQLSSGFLGFRNDETGARVEIAFEENPKLELQLDLLEELPDGSKAVVFYEYTFSGRRLYESLKTIGRKGIWLWSGTKNSAAELRRFQEDPACTVAVLNNRVGAYSLDGLQDVANYTFFYESPISPIDRNQAECRLRRDGQRRKVFVYDLIVRGTMDRRILDYHAEGDGLMQELLRNPKMFLK